MSFFTRKNIATMLVFSLFQIIISFFYVNPVDVLIHYFAAIDISNGLLLYRDIVQHTLPNGKLLPYPSYPPIYLGFLGFLFKLFGESMFLLKLHLILDNCLLAWFTYELSLRLFKDEQKEGYSEKLAYTAMIIFMVNPINWNAAFSGFFDNFVLLFVIASFIAFFDEYYAISGFILSVAVFSKQFPVILLFLYGVVLFRKRLWKESICFLSSFILTSLLISLPFLISCPERYIYELTGFHLVDVRPSSSIFYYFFPDFEFFSFIFQLISLIIIGSLIYKWIDDERESKNDSILLWAFHLSFLSFLFFNRIYYPHYLPYITVSLPFVLISIYQKKNKVRNILIILGSYTLTALFAIGYSLIWIFDSNPGDYKHLLEYWIFAFSYNLFFFVYLIYSFYLFIDYHKSKNSKDHFLHST